MNGCLYSSQVYGGYDRHTKVIIVARSFHLTKKQNHAAGTCQLQCAWEQWAAKCFRDYTTIHLNTHCDTVNESNQFKWKFLSPCWAYGFGFAEVERYGCPTELTVFVVGIPGLEGSCVMFAVPFVMDDVTPHTVVTTDREGCCWPCPCVVCGHMTVDASLWNDKTQFFSC